MYHMILKNWKRWLAVFGCLFFLISLPSLPKSFWSLRVLFQDANMAAKSLDIIKSAASPGHCLHPIKKVDIENGDRILVLNKSENLILNLENKGDYACESKISIRATTFKTDPEETQKIILAPQEFNPFLWNITPTQTGFQKIVIQSNYDTFSLGFYVKSSKYLTATQSSILTWILSLLGPILTVPWWISFIRNRRDKKSKKTNKPEIILPSHLK